MSTSSLNFFKKDGAKGFHKSTIISGRNMNGPRG